MQQIAKKLKNCEEFFAKKLTEQDKRKLMNFLCIKRGVPHRESSDGSDSGITKQSKIPCHHARENFTILSQGAALERPTFLIKFLRFWVPGPCHAVILDSREIHRIVQVLWETFLNDHLLKKDYLLQSSTIHSEIETWYYRYIKTKWWIEKRLVEYIDSSTSLPEQKWNAIPYSGNLFWSNKFFCRMESWKISWINGISKLEDQSWGLSENSRSSSHHALDQRSWDRKVIQRSYDIAIDYWKELSWLRYAWCDDRLILNTQVHFRKRVSLEEQLAQQQDRVLPERQIA